MANIQNFCNILRRKLQIYRYIWHVNYVNFQEILPLIKIISTMYTESTILNSDGQLVFQNKTF